MQTSYGKKALLAALLLCGSSRIFAECDWTAPQPILNNGKLSFEFCSEDNSVRVNDVVLHPNIDFELLFPDCPECNSIWSVLSPDGNTAVVYIENRQYERNGWVLDLQAGSVELFTDVSRGKHYLVKFSSNTAFTITHAGMGYRTDYYYVKEGGGWRNTGSKKIDIAWP